MEISAAELLYRGVFLPVSVAVTVLKTLTGQLRADISAVRPKFYTPWAKLSSSTMVLSGPLVDIAPGFGGHRVWHLSFQISRLLASGLPTGAASIESRDHLLRALARVHRSVARPGGQ